MTENEKVSESQQGIGILKFGEELERLSDGRLTIEPHYDNALGAEREASLTGASA